jgi:hypothetical protein
MEEIQDFKSTNLQAMHDSTFQSKETQTKIKDISLPILTPTQDDTVLPSFQAETQTDLLATQISVLSDNDNESNKGKEEKGLSEEAQEQLDKREQYLREKESELERREREVSLQMERMETLKENGSEKRGQKKGKRDVEKREDIEHMEKVMMQEMERQREEMEQKKNHIIKQEQILIQKQKEIQVQKEQQEREQRERERKHNIEKDFNPIQDSNDNTDLFTFNQKVSDDPNQTLMMTTPVQSTLQYNGFINTNIDLISF